MLFQYLSSRKLSELKLAGSGSDLLFLGVTLLAFKEQLRCQQNEVSLGIPCSWSLLAWSGAALFLEALSGRAVLSQGSHSGIHCLEWICAVWSRGLSPEKHHHLHLKVQKGLSWTRKHVGEMLLLCDSQVQFQLNFCLIYFRRNQQGERVSCCCC